MSRWKALAARDAAAAGECARVRELLPLFVGDDLPPAEAGVVRAHTIVCAECRQHASRQLQALRALQRATTATALPGVDDAFFAVLHADVLAAVEREHERDAAGAGAAGGGVAASWRRTGARAAVAVAAVACFVTGIWFGQGAGGDGLADRSAILPQAARPHTGGDHRLLQPMRHNVHVEPATWQEWAESWGAAPSEPGPSGLGPWDAEPIPGHGLMGRLQLRTLEARQVGVDPLSPPLPARTPGK